MLRLRDRLDLVYAGRPRNAPADRAFAAVVEEFDMPRALPEALLEGLAWDAMGRRYDTLSDLRAYSARVAAAVGAMMCVLMRVRDADALARACDLGVAMQLTNIARDVGEDARAGRLYLPLDWLDEAGLDPEAFLADPQPSARRSAAGRARLLARGRPALLSRRRPGSRPCRWRCRPGIFAARHIYAGIGGAVARAGHDSVTPPRPHLAGAKAGLAGAVGAARPGSARSCRARPCCMPARCPRSPFWSRPPPAPTAPGRLGPGPSDAPVGVLAQLEARDRGSRGPDALAADGRDEPAIAPNVTGWCRHGFGSCSSSSLPPALPRARPVRCFRPGDWYRSLTQAVLDPARLGVPGGLDDRSTSASPSRPRGWRRLAGNAYAHGLLGAADRAQHALDAGVLRPAASWAAGWW